MTIPTPRMYVCVLFSSDLPIFVSKKPNKKMNTIKHTKQQFITMENVEYFCEIKFLA